MYNQDNLLIWLDFSVSIVSDSIIEKKEGESCGPCFSLIGDCGTCIEGLECTPDPRQAEMPDLTNKCQPVGKDRSSLASTSLNFLLCLRHIV